MANKPTQKTIRIQDLADKLGTSASTVSRALNDHPKISKATKQKVLNMALKLGYKPSIPSLMSENESKAIALIIPNTSDQYYVDIIRSFKLFFERNGYVVFVAETNYDTKREAIYFEQLSLMNIRGVAYLYHGESEGLDVLDDYVEKNFPMVFIHENTMKEKVSSIILDIYQSLSDTIGHFKSYKAKNVALLIDDHKNPINSQVIEIFDEILEVEELSNNTQGIFYFNSNGDRLQDELKDFISNNVFDAILCSSMKIAYLVQKIAAAENKNILIASLSDGVFGMEASPKISHFKLQAPEIGEKVAELLMDRIENNAIAKSAAFFSRLVIKGSSISL